MEKLVKERGVFRSAFTKACNKLEYKMDAGVSVQTADLKAELLLIERKTDRLIHLDEAIFSIMLEAEQEEDLLEEEITSRDEYQVRFHNVKLKLESMFERTNSSNQSSILVEGNSREIPRFKLPKLELKKFGGDLLEWLGYWSQFSKIDCDPQMASEDKFQYLIQSTVEGSRAREFVESYPPTAENYPKAIQGLKDRFGQQDLLVEVYVRELLKLVIKNAVEQAPIHTVYDKLETSLRALESLGITTDKCASLIYPLVESSLPEEILRAHRRRVETDPTPHGRLEKLMAFIRNEIEADQRISMAMEGFGISEGTYTFKHSKIFKTKEIPTATGLIASTKNDFKVSCIFCTKAHASADCFRAQKMTLEEKMKILTDKRACFICLKGGHTAKKCRAKVRCMCCSKKHVVLMCPNLPSCSKGELELASEHAPNNSINLISRSRGTTEVFLQTLYVKLKGSKSNRVVRLMIDTGAQRSHILKGSAERVGCHVVREERLKHSLFGGIVTKECCLYCYNVEMEGMNNSYKCTFEALGQERITDYVAYEDGPWLQELKGLGVEYSDGIGPIEVLIGADLAGHLLTGRTHNLSNGLVATETLLGWTVWGKASLSPTYYSNLATVVTTLHLQETSLEDFWKLDVLGITDPVEKKTKEQVQDETLEHFLRTVSINDEERYEVHLPWRDNRNLLPSNYRLAKKRLHSITKKLGTTNMLQAYSDVLTEWKSEGIIEEVLHTRNLGHYLPHRPVFKESLSTPIRPVFDASAREPGSPSLNDCLDEGPNLIELIPSVIHRFREKRVGVTADIRKAFLQISIQPKDRDFLRFLWWDDEFKEIKVYRHTRVVFGVKCSPFLLGAVIDYHLKRHCSVDSEKEMILQQLSHGFYVDNVATSVDGEKSLSTFMDIACVTMTCGGFDLRGWECTGSRLKDGRPVNVLGIEWNCEEDTLSINMDWLKKMDTSVVTKRLILSIAQHIFDPIGFTSPVALLPKMILQAAWEKKLDWDCELSKEIKENFLDWLRQLTILGGLKIPRWLRNGKNSSIHTFIDASKKAYAAAVFLRAEAADGVSVQLVQARSRVAPLKVTTIPRLELLGASIGARMTKSVIDALSWEQMPVYIWTDSTTVLAWLKGDDQWSVFVRNRVNEIRKLTEISSWRHVPGNQNPADLPSRGCTTKQLIESRWWEGPSWLRQPPEDWPADNSWTYNAEEVLLERRKMQTSLTVGKKACDWYLVRFSRFESVIRLVAWVLRFIHNSRVREVLLRRSNELSVGELKAAEAQVFKLIQDEAFVGVTDVRLTSLNSFLDNGIIKIRTKIFLREDTESFKCPIVLPARHDAVERLIWDEHIKNSHAGVQLLLNLLRERFWILGGRKTIRRVISSCVKCRRYEGRHLQSNPPPLPSDRVREASVFEVVGVDLAGPLYLKDEKRSWICLFTCAIFRAVHIELISSLTTEAFLQAFRRFVARRGRPSVVYSDNGTNFVGSDNMFQKIDWTKISTISSAQRIHWKFNPPGAAWWGGWWERLIRLIKQLLRRTLGKACLTFQEMCTILCDCEAIINSRPLTYVSSDAVDLAPLTPSMFLQEIRQVGVPDCDHLDEISLNSRMRHLQQIRDDLRRRFRQEYLGQLAQKSDGHLRHQGLKVGEVVLVGSDNIKRLNWPLGRIVEMIPGNDGVVRLVRLKTASGELLRPIQRLYPLEITDKEGGELKKSRRNEEEKSLNSREAQPIMKTQVRSRVGRVVKVPARYND